MTFHPTSVEGFRQIYGRSPTPDELRACIDFANPPARPVPAGNGCDCYDPECTRCCDEEGNAREVRA